jgi:hypothetical protein
VNTPPTAPEPTVAHVASSLASRITIRNAAGPVVPEITELIDV